VKIAIKIYKDYGLKKLFLGLNSTALRESIGLGAYFGTYDFLIKYFTKNGNVSMTGSLLAGGFAGMGCWISMYPVDYIKTLIQTDSL
jgi:solute carrier family 25 carnitine/acylcarnitine transporter 20/29